MRNTTRSKFQHELRMGRLWRAKEILQGNIPNAGYDVELYEEYGKLLLTMGDDLEAGKYLFLSGNRRPEYDDAISIFLTRHGRNKCQSMSRSFPAAARLGKLEDYPPAVAGTFRSLDLDTALWVRQLNHESGSPTIKNRLVGFGCAIGFILFVVITLLGFVEGVKLIFFR